MAQVPESALPYHLTLENAHTVLQGLCAAFSQILGQAAELLHRLESWNFDEILPPEKAFRKRGLFW